MSLNVSSVRMVDYSKFHLNDFEFIDELVERSWYARWVLRFTRWLPVAPLDQGRPGRFNDGPTPGDEFCERLSTAVGFSGQPLVTLARYHGRRLEDRGELAQSLVHISDLFFGTFALIGLQLVLNRLRFGDW